jgi:hypothetical protein
VDAFATGTDTYVYRVVAENTNGGGDGPGGQGSGPSSSPPTTGGVTNPDGDDDGDGLINYYEAQIGTFLSEKDSDDDDLDDNLDSWPLEQKIEVPRLPDPSFAIVDIGPIDSENPFPVDLNNRGALLRADGTVWKPDTAEWANGISISIPSDYELIAVGMDDGEKIGGYFRTTNDADKQNIAFYNNQTLPESYSNPYNGTISPYDYGFYVDSVANNGHIAGLIHGAMGSEPSNIPALWSGSPIVLSIPVMPHRDPDACCPMHENGGGISSPYKVTVNNNGTITGRMMLPYGLDPDVPWVPLNYQYVKRISDNSAIVIPGTDIEGWSTYTPSVSATALNDDDWIVLREIPSSGLALWHPDETQVLRPKIVLSPGLNIDLTALVYTGLNNRMELLAQSPAGEKFLVRNQMLYSLSTMLSRQGWLLETASQLQNSGVILAKVSPVSLGGSRIMLLVPTEFKRAWETNNKANQVFNRTRKDDSTGNLTVLEKEGTATYATPRNNLYTVADDSDNTLRVTLDVDIPLQFRPKFIAAAYISGTKVSGSDLAFPSTGNAPVEMAIPVSGNGAQEYEIRIGFDSNGNSQLDANEASRIEVYRRRSDNSPRYLNVKGISKEKYLEHDQILSDKIHFLGQSPPAAPAKFARSFLALFYYNGGFTNISPNLVPSSSAVVQLDAFAEGSGFSEWLTHNSGATFSDQGSTTINEYTWDTASEVSNFFAKRSPFSLESSVTTSQGGYSEYATPTGSELKNFYNSQVKADAEAALASEPLGTSVTYPVGGGWYEFPREENQSLFASLSPEENANWVTPSTQIIGNDDNYSGYSALFASLTGSQGAFADFDAFGAIGRGRVINPRYQITIKKQQVGIWPVQSTVYTVAEVRFACSIQDLYDFNYEDSKLPSHAAAMQLGFAKGANGNSRDDHGLIYRHQINIDYIYTEPFDHLHVSGGGGQY